MIDIIEKIAGAMQAIGTELRQKGVLDEPLQVKTSDFLIPQDRRNGEISTPILMKVSSRLDRQELLRTFCEQLAGRDIPYLKEVVPAPPGYLNFHLKPEALTDHLRQLVQRPAPPVENIGRGRKVLVEFVSANPTGPLTIAHGRQAAFGEALARILSECGYAVTREYYLNDEGRQIDLLGESLKARCDRLAGTETPIPEGGYQGDYLVPMAEKLVAEFGPALREKDNRFFVEKAVTEILAVIKQDLQSFGIKFDSYQSQAELTRQGLIAETIARLEEKGVTYRSEDALFLRTTDFKDDKDRVLKKSDGSYTYLAPDLAYHRLKFQKGCDLLINLWGPDHHGYINRLKGGLQALGFDPDKIRIIILQLTTIYRGKEKIRMSTRFGEFLPLSLVTEELSPDVARFFFLSRKASSHLDFDLELAKKETAENPIFYLQYATARIASLFRYRNEQQPGPDSAPEDADPNLLREPEEKEIMLLLSRFGPTVVSAAESFEPQVLLTYLLSLVKVFHRYYQRCQIVGPDSKLTASRLMLISGLEKTLKQGFLLLNVYAPDQM